MANTHSEKPTKHYGQARKRARRKLSALLAQHGNRCYWCDAYIVEKAILRNCEIVSETAHEITWRNERDEITTALIATVDHVDPLWMVGETDESNLVPSCRKCNEEHGRQNEPRVIFGQMRFGTPLGEILKKVLKGTKYDVDYIANRVEAICGRLDWDSSCSGKVRYGHLETAERARVFMESKKGEKFESYECRYCAKWHIGHARPE